MGHFVASLLLCQSKENEKMKVKSRYLIGRFVER